MGHRSVSARTIGTVTSSLIEAQPLRQDSGQAGKHTIAGRPPHRPGVQVQNVSHVRVAAGLD